MKLLNFAFGACVFANLLAPHMASAAPGDWIYFNTSGDKSRPEMYRKIGNEVVAVSVPLPILQYSGSADLLEASFNIVMPDVKADINPYISELRDSQLTVSLKPSATYDVKCSQAVDHMHVEYGQYLAGCTVRMKDNSRWLASNWQSFKNALPEVMGIYGSYSVVGKAVSMQEVAAQTVTIRPNVREIVEVATSRLKASGLIASDADGSRPLSAAVAHSGILSVVGLDFCGVNDVSNLGEITHGDDGKAYNYLLFSSVQEAADTCETLKDLAKSAPRVAADRYRELRNALFDGVVAACSELDGNSWKWGSQAFLKVVNNSIEIKKTLRDAFLQEKVEVTKKTVDVRSVVFED